MFRYIILDAAFLVYIESLKAHILQITINRYQSNRFEIRFLGSCIMNFNTYIFIVGFSGGASAGSGCRVCGEEGHFARLFILKT